MFNDASQFIQGSSATVLSLGATDEIDLTATLIDINGNADVSGTVTATGTSVFASLDISGDIDVDGTTNLDVVDIDGAVQRSGWIRGIGRS
jgi:cytoskeletal protein CcmA (bactofilin family)